jgi:hypothetical protein
MEIQSERAREGEREREFYLIKEVRRYSNKERFYIQGSKAKKIEGILLFSEFGKILKF